MLSVESPRALETHLMSSKTLSVNCGTCLRMLKHFLYRIGMHIDSQFQTLPNDSILNLRFQILSVCTYYISCTTCRDTANAAWFYLFMNKIRILLHACLSLVVVTDVADISSTPTVLHSPDSERSMPLWYLPCHSICLAAFFKSINAIILHWLI